MTAYVVTVLVVLGLCLGSFVNALVWRLHESMKPAKKRAASSAELSIVTGRSMCVHCKHPLATKDLIPLFSWLTLRGKCRYCKHRIDDNPIVELLLPIAFVWSYVAWPHDLVGIGLIGFVVWIITLVGLAALTVFDIKWMLLPNKIVYPLILLALAYSLLVAALADEPLSVGLALVLSVVLAGGLFHILFEVSDGKWIGGGDVKLGYLIGLLLGTPVLSTLALFIASVLGVIVILPKLARQKITAKSRIPFGPFLIAGLCIVVLYGQRLVDWYLALVLV